MEKEIEIKGLFGPKPEYFCGPWAGGMSIVSREWHSSQASWCHRAMFVSWRPRNRKDEEDLLAWVFYAN